MKKEMTSVVYLIIHGKSTTEQYSFFGVSIVVILFIGSEADHAFSKETYEPAIQPEQGRKPRPPKDTPAARVAYTRHTKNFTLKPTSAYHS